MIHMLAVKTTGYLMKNEVGQAEHKDLYIYGIQILIEKLITYFILFLLALHFKLLLPSILFIVFFVSLRGYTGGYHANTYLGCLLGTTVMYLTCSQVLAPFLVKKEIVIIFGTIVAVIIILKLAPINHPNLNMNSKEIIMCKYRMKVVLAAETLIIIGGIICRVNKIYIVFSFLGILMCATLLALAKIMKQEVKVHEEIY